MSAAFSDQACHSECTDADAMQPSANFVCYSKPLLYSLRQSTNGQNWIHIRIKSLYCARLCKTKPVQRNPKDNVAITCKCNLNRENNLIVGYPRLMSYEALNSLLFRRTSSFRNNTWVVNNCLIVCTHF